MVAEERGISRAASRLLIAQPALTRQIHDLERAVGIPLFDRDHHGVQLTSAGIRLRQDVEHVFERLEDTVRRVLLAHEGKLATLRLGLSRAAVESRRIGQLLMVFRVQYPQVELLVRELPVWAHHQALMTDEVDAAIGLGADADAALNSELIFEEHVDSAMFAVSHKLAVGGPLDPEELQGEQCRLDSVSMPRFPELRDSLSQLGFVWDELEGLDTVFGYVAAGNGWTPTLSTAHADPPAGLAVRRIRGLDVPLRMMLRWGRNNDLPAVRNLVAVAAQLFRPDSTDQQSSAVGLPSSLKEEDASLPLSPTRSVEVAQLRAFVTSLNEGSLSGAAELLGLTQSAISRQIGSLERALGVPLLARAGGRLLPTAAGTVLRDEAPAVLELVDNALERARRTVRGMTGRCAIGTISRELTNGLLVESLKRLTERYPEVTITMVEGGLQSALLAGDVDLAIVSLYPGAAEDPSLESMQLQEDPLTCALISASHPLAQHEMLSPADLADVPLLFVSREFAPQAYDLIIREVRQVGLGASLGAEYNGARAIWRAVASGEGWALGPRSLCHSPPSGIVARPIRGVNIPWGIGLQWRREESDPVVVRVADVFRAQADTPA